MSFLGQKFILRRL